MATPDMKQIITTYKTIAVVGLSPDEGKPSHEVAAYLKRAGYRIIPVNPSCQEIFGERCYPTLAEVPDQVEIVDIFRRSEFVPEIVDQAIAKGAKVVWMQEGVVNETAAAKAEAAGLAVVMDRCLLKEHVKLRSR
ncbi:CoA-binding protein [Geomonas sp.]|uniref:CoA-binding protein n=1 Tax=Geomonas sp. TaxID=2651584 RepID=UPI002B4888A0|nr:CoA-binding protein [Geomonas sp.]HJV37022.1 CoA-binding protein [Geomonas sp.]